MPTYEFLCNACNKAFSLVMKVSELEISKITCPHCGRKDVRQMFSSFFAKTSRKS
jgi:putative FmdB family regulatory protein